VDAHSAIYLPVWGSSSAMFLAMRSSNNEYWIVVLLIGRLNAVLKRAALCRCGHCGLVGRKTSASRGDFVATVLIGWERPPHHLRR